MIKVLVCHRPDGLEDPKIGPRSTRTDDLHRMTF